ncbi:cation/H(+) antiporter 27-like [Euphorbia lathyris]|uniref:cation/H(+) antiporter 27-like n=1 Tax=Euphorbia lathyris TaxID=212925 RepID=UPI0033137721
MPHSWKQPAHLTVLCEEVALNNTMQFRQGHDLHNWPMQLVILQIALVNSFKFLFQLVLTPFGQLTYVPQIMGAIAIGPSFLGQYDFFYEQILYAPKGVLMIGIFRAMAFMFLLFLLSMRIDFTVLRKCGKLAVIIGISSLFIPMILTTFFALFLRTFFEYDAQVYESLPSVAILVATTSFHVILVSLTDLKLLNSEIGRLALASAMISGLISWLFLAIIFDIQEDIQMGIRIGVIFSQFSKVISVLIIVFIFRPIILWMVRKTPDGKALKEPYICSILPCYVIDAGRRSDIFLVGHKEFAIIQLVMFFASLTKIISVVIPALFFKMPFLDALTLGFILNCKGLFDVQLYSRANKVMLITDENFAILVISSALHAVIFTCLARQIFDPSRRYIAYKRRTIQHSNENNMDLKVLACIHQQYNMPSIVSVLEDAYPSKDEPIQIYAMNLKQSVGGTVPLLIPHQLDISKSNDKKVEINRITNAFFKAHKRNEGLQLLQCFTSYAPTPTLHDAVCSMALEKTTSLIIIPFQHSDDATVRIVNRNILDHAPCSVGLIFDNGKLSRSLLPTQALVRVCVVFLGGPDDRETLAFGARMAMNPNIKFTLIRLVTDHHSDADLIEKRRDSNMINDFMTKTNQSTNQIRYMEHTITEGSETAKLLRDACQDFELMLVGRRHDPESAILSGLSEWREIEELGVVGDMLASTDFDCRALILVIQQQAAVVEEMIGSPKTRQNKSTLIDWTSAVERTSWRARYVPCHTLYFNPSSNLCFIFNLYISDIDRSNAILARRMEISRLGRDR